MLWSHNSCLLCQLYAFSVYFVFISEIYQTTATTITTITLHHTKYGLLPLGVAFSCLFCALRFSSKFLSHSLVRFVAFNLLLSKTCDSYGCLCSLRCYDVPAVICLRDSLSLFVSSHFYYIGFHEFCNNKMCVNRGAFPLQQPN